MLVVLALTAEVALPVKESLMDSLLRGLDNERDAFSFHTHYITGFGSCCQDLFIKFLVDIVLNQFLLHLCNSITIALTAEPYGTITPTKVGRKLTQPFTVLCVARVKFNNGAVIHIQRTHQMISYVIDQ
jgi:hypothetical protein